MQHHDDIREAILNPLRSARIAVIGDLLLDHYVHGSVSRISPEAPVPILKIASERYTLGGAANVAANAASLGAEVCLIGLIGDDPAGRTMQDLLSAYPSIRANVVCPKSWPTVTKSRYVSSNNQMVRVDRESDFEATTESVEPLLTKVEQALRDYEVIVLSDYGKGVLNDLVLRAILSSPAAASKKIIVDPERKRFHDYRGAWMITPNRNELTEATGLNCVEDAEAGIAAAAAIEQCGANILLTRSERGMSLFGATGEPIHLAARAQEVFDVSGAGDTVVAAVAAATGAGLSVATAMNVANIAAGIVVANFGTAVCTLPESEKAMRRSIADEASLVGLNNTPLGLLPLRDLVAARRAWSAQGLTVGFTNGCFDLVHPGHVSLLEQASAVCDRLIVAINSDASVSRLKGPTRPIQKETARARVVHAIRGVHAVMIFDEETPIDAITALEPDVLIKGADYTEETVVGADIVKRYGGRIMLARLEDGFSTTSMVQRANLPAQDVAHAGVS